MSSTASLATSNLSCPACDGPVEVKSRHVAIAGTTVRVYCSAECMRMRVKPAPPPPLPIEAAPKPRRRSMWWLAGGAAGAACVIVSTAIYVRNDDDVVVDVPPPPSFNVAVATGEPPVPAPVDPRIAEDQAVIQEILQDTWIHPLAGPVRRMPVNHNGAFGASRPGERPPECVSGHCGVDIGHLWGEPIHAVHDGVVDWVNRGPNEDRGGVFVKIAHRNGTLFSWYFHLAAVPRRIVPGAKVAAGEVIGLLGDTGVKQSAPHLHFSLSVKTSKKTERYLDPEPLIAIWPLWIRNEEGGGRPSSTSDPGVPVREHSSSKRRKKRGESTEPEPGSASGPAAPAPEPPAADPAPAATPSAE